MKSSFSLVTVILDSALLVSTALAPSGRCRERLPIHIVHVNHVEVESILDPDPSNQCGLTLKDTSGTCP